MKIDPGVMEAHPAVVEAPLKVWRLILGGMETYPRVMEAHPGVLEAHLELRRPLAMEANPGVMEANPGAIEVTLEPWRLNLSHGGNLIHGGST